MQGRVALDRFFLSESRMMSFCCLVGQVEIMNSGSQEAGRTGLSEPCDRLSAFENGIVGDLSSHVDVVSFVYLR